MRVPALIVLLCPLLFSGCDSPAPTAAPEPLATASSEPAPPVTMNPMHAVMAAKLGYAGEILEGLARADYEQIEEAARQLELTSREASWMITDSVTYVLYSEQFREITGDLADHARRGNIERATLDFMQMTQTCVLCHTYLRRERLTRDFPERVTMVSPPSPDARLRWETP